jgi:hypothetical protein
VRKEVVAVLYCLYTCIHLVYVCIAAGLCVCTYGVGGQRDEKREVMREVNTISSI